MTLRDFYNYFEEFIIQNIVNNYTLVYHWTIPNSIVRKKEEQDDSQCTS